MKNLLELYIKSIKQYKLLTKKKEILLLAAYKYGSKTALDKLINANLRFVIKIAKEYHIAWPNFDIMDLIQEGNIGLMQGIKKRNTKSKERLSTYISYWIKATIYNYIKQNQSSIRITNTKAHRKIFDNLTREREYLEQKGLPTNTEHVAKVLNVNENDIVTVEPLLTANGVVSLFNTEINDTTYDTEVLYIKKETEQRLNNKIEKFKKRKLSPKQEFVFTKRMIADKPLTQKLLAKITLTTQQNIFKIEQIIIRKARKFFKKEDIKELFTNE